jgi:NAD(P)H-hydrate epimerase
MVGYGGGVDRKVFLLGLEGVVIDTSSLGKNSANAITSAEMKALDRHTIEKIGIPSMVLMERAALASVEVLTNRSLHRRCSGFNLDRVVCVCGAGNNGGDGFAVARLLHLAGIRAEVLFVGDRDHMSDETRQQRAIAASVGVKIYDNCLSALIDVRASTIVDALFGIGLTRPLSGIQSEVVHAINESISHRTMDNVRVLALDIPSGISADTGEILGAAVKANVTVTFAYPKIGLTHEPGKAYAGRIIVKDIGIYR